MCIAFVIPKEESFQLPSDEEWARMEEQNPDGGGLGWAEQGSARWLKGLTGKEIQNHLDILPRPLFVHFRLGSVDPKRDPALTHPFPITRAVSSDLSGFAPSIMMHNGHWYGWQQAYTHACWVRAMPDGPWSDTRFAAFLMARHEHSRVFSEMGTKNKVAIMNHRGDFTLLGDWVKEQGILYSNLTWKHVTPLFISRKSQDGYGWKYDGDGGWTNPYGDTRRWVNGKMVTAFADHKTTKQKATAVLQKKRVEDRANGSRREAPNRHERKVFAEIMAERGCDETEARAALAAMFAELSANE